MLVYLELNDNYLLLSKLKETTDKFFLIKPEKIELKNCEFKNGILYNPSALFLYIYNFLKRNKIRNPKTIACVNFNQNQSKQILSTLQVALCFCKSGLKIGKIINNSLLKKEEEMPFSDFFYKKELEHQLDFFKTFTQEQHKFSKKFLIFFGLIFILLLPTLFIVQKNKNSELKKIQNKNSELFSANQVLEKKVEAFNSLKKNNILLKQKIEKIQNHQSSTNNLQKLLLHATKQIPKDCNLSSIKIESLRNKEIGAKSKITLFKIEGSTTNHQDVTQLLQKLSKDPELNKLRISKLQKIKNLNLKKCTNLAINPTFSFQIIGEIKKI